MTSAELRAWIAEYNSEALLADGFESAILGVAERCSKPALVVYDVDQCLEILIAEHGLDYEEALEYFDFNVRGAWVGEHTPLFLYRRPPEEELMPAKSEKQRQFMGAELERARKGKKTRTGMTQKQLKDFAKKPPKKT